jgi:hypothetical protein
MAPVGQKWNRSAALAAFLVALVCPAPWARAALVLSIDGTIPPPPPGSAVSVTPGGPAGAVGNVLDEIFRGSSTLFNGAPILGGNVATLIISSQTITAVASVAGVTTYTLATDPQDTSFKELLFNAAHGGGVAVFDPIFSEAVVDSAALDMLILRGTETVSFNSNPTFDFSPLQGGFITVTLNGPPGTDFNALLSSDDTQSVTVVGTFSQFTVVPEPRTAVLLGMGLLLLGALYRTGRQVGGNPAVAAIGGIA